LRRFFLSAGLLLVTFAAAAPAQSPVQSQTQPPTLSVDSIFGDHSILPSPPDDFYWSPTGSAVAYFATEDNPGAKIADGDLIAIDAATGKTHVLASHTQLTMLDNPSLAEVDLDHRLRYGMPTVLWSPDEKSLLLDAAGSLWLYDLASGSSRKLTAAAPSADDPKFSPDAKFVSYIRDHNLYMRAINSKASADDSTQEISIAASPDPAILNGEADWVYLEELNVRSNYFWSPDSSRIAYLQSNESAVPQCPLTDFSGDHATTFLQHYPQPGDPNPDVRIGIVDVRHPDNGAHTRWINLPFSHNNDYIPRFGWLDSKTLWIEVLERSQQHLHLYFADISTNKVNAVFTESDPKFLDTNYDFTFLPRGQFVFASWRDGHTHLYLYSYNESAPLSAPATLVRQLTTGDFDVDSVAGLSDDGADLYFTSNEANPLGRQLYSVPLSGGKPQPLTAGTGTHDISLSPDRRTYIDTASTISSPENISLCHINSEDAPASCTSFWSTTAPALPDPIALELKSADNSTPLYGWLTLPMSSSTASVPLVLNPYGGPAEQGVRDMWLGDETLFNQLLAQHGIAVLTVDNRGMAMRGRNFALAAYRNFGPVQFADQLAALDQVLALYPQLDPHRLGFWGWSWGGSFTLYALSHSDRFLTGVAVAPVTAWQFYDSIYTERYLGLPADDPDTYRIDSVLNDTANLHGHLLLAHGTADDNVHLLNTMQYVQALIVSGKPSDLQLFPQKTHDLLGAEARIALYTRILNQFETDLK
jgi:dipeptidyl-peptidase-4